MTCTVMMGDPKHTLYIDDKGLSKILCTMMVEVPQYTLYNDEWGLPKIHRTMMRGAVLHALNM